MDKSKIIQQGDTAKYSILIVHDDFDMGGGDFRVVLIPRFGMVKTIYKSDMLHNEDGVWFFCFATDEMVGKITAECHYFLADTDIDGGIREEIDRQYIGFVTSDPCPRFAMQCKCTDDIHVTYRRAMGTDVNTAYHALMTNAGEPLETTDGKVLQVHKTDDDIYN